MIDYMKRTNVVLTEHIGKSNMSLKAKTKAVDTHIYERDTGWLRECDMVIAECTCPSLGVGYELGYAEAHGIPVFVFSAMLNGNAHFTIVPYETEEECFSRLEDILQQN